MTPMIGAPVTVTANRQDNSRVFLSVGFLVVGMMLAVVPLMIDKAGIGFFFGMLVVVLFGFFYLMFKWMAIKVELELTPDGVLVEKNLSTGLSREFALADFAEFAFMSDQRGNYWVRIKTRDAGPMQPSVRLRYAHPPFKFKQRQPFIDFGNTLRRFVTKINNKEIEVAQPERRSDAAQQIKTGLSKTEKVTNASIYIRRIIVLIVVLISGIGYIAGQAHPGEILGYFAIGAVVAGGIVWYMKKKKAAGKVR